MTQIIRENINSDCIPNDICMMAECLKACSDDIKSVIRQREGNDFDIDNSVVLHDTDSIDIFGYIITKKENIPHIEDVFKNNKLIIDYLTNADGLYVKKIILHEKLSNDMLVTLLNTMHLTYCNGNLTDDQKYIWMNIGEIIFSKTEQQEDFFQNAPNKVSKAFLKYLCQTNINIDTIL